MAPCCGDWRCRAQRAALAARLVAQGGVCGLAEARGIGVAYMRRGPDRPVARLRAKEISASCEMARKYSP